jgi:hypothetical protein
MQKKTSGGSTSEKFGKIRPSEPDVIQTLLKLGVQTLTQDSTKLPKDAQLTHRR